MAIPEGQRIAAVLTSFAPGGLVRARLDENVDLQPGDNVVAFDELAELEVRAEVVRIEEGFAYLQADWCTAQEYIEVDPKWNWADVYEIYVTTVRGSENFSRVGSPVGTSFDVGRVGSQYLFHYHDRVFFPGVRVTVKAPVPGADATMRYTTKGSSGYMTLHWDTVSPIQVYREVPQSYRNHQQLYRAS